MHVTEIFSHLHDARKWNVLVSLKFKGITTMAVVYLKRLNYRFIVYNTLPNYVPKPFAVVCVHKFCMCTLQVCTYVCMYVCMYVFMYICIYVHVHVCMYICMYVCMCVHSVCAYVCMYVRKLRMYVCMYAQVCVHECLYVCVLVHVCTCMYTCNV